MAFVTKGNLEASNSHLKLSRLRGESFSDLVLEAIDQALTDLLGAKVRDSIYDYLARERSISKTDIATRTDDLASLLESTFGKGGRTIEKSIIRNLHARLRWEFSEISSCGLADYLDMARNRFEKEFPSQLILI